MGEMKMFPQERIGDTFRERERKKRRRREKKNHPQKESNTKQ